MRTLTVLMTAMSLSLPALAKPVRKPVVYELEGRKYEGVLVYDDSVKKPRPGLLLVPNWMGISEANLVQAELVAAGKYVIFVADLYGQGQQPQSQAQAGKLSGAIKADRALMRRRTAKALEVFQAQKLVEVDQTRLGAIGFCFGGTAVLELAKDGAFVKGVVSFHGGLDAPVKTEKTPRASILALHGASDPTISPQDLKAFQEDLTRVKADWTLVSYGGAVHSFTDPEANSPGVSQYEPLTADRAYKAMNAFLDEQFEAR